MDTKHGETGDADGSQSRYYRLTTFIHLLLLLTMLAGCISPAAYAEGSRADLVEPSSPLKVTEPLDKIQPYLSTLAMNDPQDLVRVIVQYQGEQSKFTSHLESLDGIVVNDLSLINALVVQITAGELPALAHHEAVRWIALDAPVRKSSATDGSANNARDDFDQVTFDGSSGALPWSSDWVELGESDGPAGGNVMVTTFWGGALQGLRLRGPQIGIMRGVDLGVATNANLGLAFRRKDFVSDQDYITIEVSQDGGASWREVTRLGGPATDAAIQYGDFDLSIVATDKTAADKVLLRFQAAPSMNTDASFYLDAVDVRLDFSQAIDQPKANHIFLPLIAGGDEVIADATEVATRTKPEELARIDDARSGCNYHCFDLSALQSTHIKAIGADKIWNVSPYIRGWGVTVAVVDSGIAPHPDLNDYYGNSRLIAQVNFVPNSNVPDDFYGHGSHVAGTIAGLGTSSSGAFMGVAPEARLVDVKVTDDYGMGNTSDVVAGIQWIYNNRNNYNIKVANLSLNSTVPESYHVSALNAALEVLWFNKITVVVSAGNGGQEKLYPPANDPFAIVVGSADDKGTASISDDKLSKFSAYGVTTDGFAKPDLVAPGQDIISLLASDDMNLKKTLPLNAVLGYMNKYFKMSGTSMASAVMAGAVALLLEDTPSLSPDQIKYRLTSTSQPFSVNEGTCATGAGYLDIYAAVHNNSSQSANTGIQASQLLWSGSNPITWGSVSWNSVSWNSVSWNSVSWNSVSWNSVSWNSVSWNSSDDGSSSSSNDCSSAFSKFTLVNAQTAQDIRPLYHNAVIDLDSLPTTYVTIRADTTGPVESVRFDKNYGAYTKIENLAPYSLFGDGNGSYGGNYFYPGVHQVKVSAYATDNTQGALLATEAIEMLFVSSTYKPRLRAAHSNRCIQPTSQSSSNGVALEQSSCYSTNAQKYRLQPVTGKQDIVNIVNVQNGLCVDVTGSGSSNGTEIIQWGCQSSENQQFRLKGTGVGTFNLIAVHSGKCVTVENGSTGSGADIIQETCGNDTTNQQWRFD